MNISRKPLAFALLAAIAAPAAHAQVAIDVIGGSEVTFEGLVQADGNWFSNDIANLNGAAGDGSENDAELRRAELVMKGKGPGNIEWVAGYDAKAKKFLDTNIKYKIGGDGNHYFQLGQYKQPNSMEELSSTKNNDFISKAMITNTWAVARRLGAAYGFGDNNWGVTGSVFGRELTRNLAHGSGYGARGYWAPVNEKGSIVHVGLSYVDYDSYADTVQWRVRPDADLAGARLIDTGALKDTDRQHTLGLEGLWVHGPMKLQGEYMRSGIKRYGTTGNYNSDGWYVSGLWNVTGETWGYKGGVPTTGLPDQPASGMWQLGLRYDTMDLNDGVVKGGKMDTITLGANWYLRSNFKLALNYVKVNSSRYIGKTSASYSLDPAFNSRTFNAVVDDNPNIIEARAQFYW